MFETAPVTMVSLTTDAAQMFAQAGPPADLPGPVPDFVGDILGTIGAAAGDAMGGVGERVSDLTPAGT
jgi:hypothetical protein